MAEINFFSVEVQGTYNMDTVSEHRITERLITERRKLPLMYIHGKLSDKCFPRFYTVAKAKKFSMYGKN
jgi:hypothetical protein